MNFFTGITELINVWSNEAHKLIFVISMIYLPIFALLQIHNFKNILLNSDKKIFKALKTNFIETTFLIISLIYVSGLAGIGQFMFISIIDSLLRAVGIFFYTIGLFSDIYLTMSEKGNYLILLIRYPRYMIVLFISIGLTLMTVNFFCLIFLVIIFISIAIKIKRIENAKVKLDKDYYDYIKQVPAIIPRLKTIRDFIKKIS